MHQPEHAEPIYQALLLTHPQNRAALLGRARILRQDKRYDPALAIYNAFLAQDAHDIDALNGLGWTALAQQHLQTARRIFKEILTIQPDNKEALLGLKDSKQAPPIEAVKPPRVVDPDAPALHLAARYESAASYKQALLIYQRLLAKNPSNKAALLGSARVLRFTYQIKPSLLIYQQLLAQYPKDIEVLSGLGETYLANYELDKARALFNKIERSHPENKQVRADLSLLNQTTNNILDVSVGHYSVPPATSDGLNLYYFRNLNATDGWTLLGTHNTKQIESSFGAGSALLPNNSLLMGYQHLVPKQYGWQASYDARQHDGLPFEHRLYGSTNLYLQPNLEWFGGVRLAAPSIWNTQLLISGLNVYTSLPVNCTVTGFWAFQEIGGYTSSYSLDLSKEYNSHLFYDLGPSYLVEQQSWEVHGRLIFPIFKTQALVFQASHYMFNNSTFINAGWRMYWAQ
jgi:tetratricopeptide (TPR) repeat protein